MGRKGRKQKSTAGFFGTKNFLLSWNTAEEDYGSSLDGYDEVKGTGIERDEEKERDELRDRIKRLVERNNNLKGYYPELNVQDELIVENEAHAFWHDAGVINSLEIIDKQDLGLLQLAGGDETGYGDGLLPFFSEYTSNGGNDVVATYHLFNTLCAIYEKHLVDVEKRYEEHVVDIEEKFAGDTQEEKLGNCRIERDSARRRIDKAMEMILGMEDTMTYAPMMCLDIIENGDHVVKLNEQQLIIGEFTRRISQGRIKSLQKDMFAYGLRVNTAGTVYIGPDDVVGTLGLLGSAPVEGAEGVVDEVKGVYVDELRNQFDIRFILEWVALVKIHRISYFKKIPIVFITRIICDKSEESMLSSGVECFSEQLEELATTVPVTPLFGREGKRTILRFPQLCTFYLHDELGLDGFVSRIIGCNPQDLMPSGMEGDLNDDAYKDQLCQMLLDYDLTDIANREHYEKVLTLFYEYKLPLSLVTVNLMLNKASPAVAWQADAYANLIYRLNEGVVEQLVDSWLPVITSGFREDVATYREKIDWLFEFAEGQSELTGEVVQVLLAVKSINHPYVKLLLYAKDHPGLLGNFADLILEAFPLRNLDPSDEKFKKLEDTIFEITMLNIETLDELAPVMMAVQELGSYTKRGKILPAEVLMLRAIEEGVSSDALKWMLQFAESDLTVKGCHKLYLETRDRTDFEDINTLYLQLAKYCCYERYGSLMNWVKSKDFCQDLIADLDRGNQLTIEEVIALYPCAEDLGEIGERVERVYFELIIGDDDCVDARPILESKFDEGGDEEKGKPNQESTEIAGSLKDIARHFHEMRGDQERDNAARLKADEFTRVVAATKDRLERLRQQVHVYKVSRENQITRLQLGNLFVCRYGLWLMTPMSYFVTVYIMPYRMRWHIQVLICS